MEPTKIWIVRGVADHRDAEWLVAAYDSEYMANCHCQRLQKIADETGLSGPRIQLSHSERAIAFGILKKMDPVAHSDCSRYYYSVEETTLYTHFDQFLEAQGQ